MKVLIFGGTTEGRMCTQRYLCAGDDVLACVTSDYAKALLPPGTRTIARAMDESEMRALIQAEQPDLVIDATHPFAVRATENILNAARGFPLQRIKREKGAFRQWEDDVEWVDSPEAAAGALGRTQGNILLTTGSHSMHVYADALPLERLYARVLATSRVLIACEELGMQPGHVIAMQGPFSQALNAAIYDALSIRALVSKDSGEKGGVTDKVLPALARDIHVIMIRRPEE